MDAIKGIPSGVTVVALVLTGASVCALARESGSTDAIPPDKVLEPSGGPYCGVYCVYACLRVHGLAIDFRQLLEPRYVGNPDGSSLGELALAASDYGAHAEALDDLSALTLEASPSPIILHVRRPGLGTPYTHWILFLGLEEGKARIVDPPGQVMLLPVPELLALWDGVGLVISKDAYRSWAIFLTAWSQEAITLFAVAALLYGLRTWLSGGTSGDSAPARPLRAICRTTLTACSLLAAAIFFGTVVHASTGTGFFRNPTALAHVAGRHFDPKLPVLSAAEVDSALTDGHTTVVDSRIPADFERGHLPGAVNLPVFSGLAERQRLADSLNKGDRVVVYCQSNSCPWSKAIGSDLYFRGFSKVAVFSGGWVEWRQYQARRSKR